MQKQMNQEFDLTTVHNQLKENQFGGSDRHYCEYQIEVALNENDSTKPLKRIFAIQYLTDTLENRYLIDATFLMPVILMLLTDKDATIRKYAFALARVFTENHNNKNQLEIYQDTEKPKSV